MVKADIVDAVHSKIGLSKTEASDVVEAVFDVMRETLRSGESIQIVGFGSFNVRKKKERVGRNPKTGEEIMISPRRVLTFKSSQILKDRVNDSYSPAE